MNPRPLLIVMPSLERGGAERHAVWMATSIDPGRWSPHVLSFADGQLGDELTAAGIPVEIVDLPSGYRSLAAGAAAVRRSVDRLRPAVVTGHHIRVEAAVRLALRGRDVPNITWKHTYGHVGYRGIRERLFEATTGAGTRYAAVCHTQVRYLTEVLALPHDRISVVPNGIPVPPDAPVAAPAGRSTVLMVAAMRADKDHALVLRAWAAVLAEHPNAVLRLAGDGPCRSDLERLAGELGIVDRVEFLGVRSDVESLLATSQLLVLASYAVECFPYAVLEAMAAGRGVVSTNVAGLPELVDDGVTGRLVPPHDARQLANAIVDGLTEPNWRNWGLAGWQRARTVFPLDRWADEVADVFDDVAAAPQQPVFRIPSARKTLQ